MKHLIVIGGATATGKTALAIKLAQYFNAAILSADSRQFFREMSIGTAKPTPDELSAAKHFFIDTLSIVDEYSVGDFERDALSVLEKLFSEKDVAILVGGSGLYVRAVCEGLDRFPEISQEIRAFVEEGEQKHGLIWLQEHVEKLDPAYYKLVDSQNPARLRRALEVCLESGQPYSSFRKNTRHDRNFEPIYVLLDLPRSELYQRIESRVDQMIEQGLETEARALLPFREKSALKTVGYEEFFLYFDGTVAYDETVTKIKQHSRNYAKRQATWFRKHGEWAVFHPIQFVDILEHLKKCMGKT